jgi:predicted O-methyltransferase YrrM
MHKTLPIVHPLLDAYMHRVTPSRDAVLKSMEARAKKFDFPIIGPLVGRTLFLLARLTKARRILELGSGYGYSAYWFGKAIGAKGEIFCTEGNADNIALAKQYHEHGKIRTGITYLEGDALSNAKKLKGTFDIILIDINKHEYPEALKFAVSRLRKGGLIITDNVLWSGKVLNANPEKTTKRIIEYTKKAYGIQKLFTVILPIRDGVAVSMKVN